MQDPSAGCAGQHNRPVPAAVAAVASAEQLAPVVQQEAVRNVFAVQSQKERLLVNSNWAGRMVSFD